MPISRYWICGNYYDSKKAWEKICQDIGNPNVQTFECDGVSTHSVNRSAQASDIILELKMRDIFDSRPRVLKIKGIPSDYDLLTDYLRLTSNNNILVFFGPIGYRKPPSKRLISVKQTKFYKEFLVNGKILEFPEIVSKDSIAIDWVIRVFSEHKKSIDREAAALLVSYKGLNLDLLYSEIIKLIDYQSGKKILDKDIKDCCVPVFLNQVWDLIDHIVYNDVDSAMSHLQGFYESAGIESGSSFRGEVENLLGAFNKQFIFYAILKDSSQDSLNYNNIKNRANGWKKKTDNGWDTEYFDMRYINFNINKESSKQICQWPKYRVYTALREIMRTKLALRTYNHVSEYNRGGIKLLIDILVLQMCGALTSRQTESIRGDYYERD